MNRRNTRHLIGALGVGLALSGAGAFGQANDAVLDLLVKKGVINQREANEIRDQADAQMAQAVDNLNKIKTPSWLQSLTISGDVRLRDEYFSYENNPATGKPSAVDRNRFRFRLRVGAEMEFQDWATAGFRLSSGEQGGRKSLDLNTNSGNQTFNNDFSRKPISIDLAYITLHPPQADWIKVTGGKMLWQTWEPKLASPMIQDPDVNPEGLSETLQYKLGDKEQYRVWATGGQYVLNEFSSDVHDAYMFDQQIGLEAKINDRLKATVAGGVYITQNLAELGKNGKPLVTLPTDSPTFGNATRTVGGTTGYLDDFQVAYGRAELAWTINDKTFLGTPNLVTISGEWIKNLNTSYDELRGADQHVDKHQTIGWTGQIAYGDNKKKGQWRLAYQYKVLQADSTFDVITDDDYGTGGTDRRGHVVELTYNLRDWWQFRIMANQTMKISDRPNSGHNSTGFDGQNLFRAQFDTMVKF